MTEPKGRRGVAGTGGALLALGAALAASGCSWGDKYRPARPGETLELESVTFTVPEGPGAWKVSRYRDAGARALELAHSTGGVVDRWVALVEREDGGAPAPREDQLADARTHLLRIVGDASARVHEISAPVDPRFGPSAVQVLAFAEESDASAGLLVKRTAGLAALEAVPPSSPDRLATLSYAELARRGGTAAELEASWRAVLANVRLRAVDGAAVRAAATGDFPKTLKPGLARRSLTLPQAGFRLGFAAERWVAPGDWEAAYGIAAGLTDRLQLDLPGVLTYALGDPEALTTPEVAIGAGLTRVGYGSTDGWAWGAGLSARARKRLGADVAVVARGFLELADDPPEDRRRLYGGGSAGVVWDVHGLVSLGLEAGYASRDGQPSPWIAWIGGRTTPLVGLHFPPLDVGLTGGVGWDGDGVGLLAGVGAALTF